MSAFHKQFCRMLFTSVIFFTNGQLWAESPHIVYDKSSDKISISANDASYKETLARIASLSGIEILMDPKAEHTFTTNINDLPLETALKQLSHRTSFILVHNTPETDGSKPQAKPAKPILISMRILPKGEFDTDKLLPVLAPTGEAFIREKNRYSAPAQQVEIFDHAKKRWVARLKTMPPEKREKLLEAAQEKHDRLTKKRNEREQRKKDHAKKREEHQKRRDARLEELRLSDPERYERRMKLREERQLNANAE